jgi:hypothetical protein
VETDDDELALAVYMDAIDLAQSMDRKSVRRRAGEQFATARIAVQVIAALAGVRGFAVSRVTNSACAIAG